MQIMMTSDWDTVSVPHPINAEDSFDGGVVTMPVRQDFTEVLCFTEQHRTIPEIRCRKETFP